MNNLPNQGYWFVVTEDQSNVIFSSNNNFTIQNAHIPGQETRYIVDTTDRQYIQINETTSVALPTTVQEITTDRGDTEFKQVDNSFWDRSKIKLLLALCLENNVKNATKDKALFNDIASHLGTTPEECCKKYKILRRTFVRLLKKKTQGKDIKWVYYNLCEQVFNECKLLPASVLEPWDDYKVRNLLSLYIDNLSRIRNPDCVQKDVWKDIASHIGTTEYNCYHKFKNLKRAYCNWLQRSRETGKPLKWPYHQYFERIFYNYSPNTGPWNRTKTRQLIDAYLQMADKFKNPRYQKKDLWKEISTIVDESAHSCDKKFRNLKQTYLKLKLRAGSGRSNTKWRYYKDFETIYSPTQYGDAMSCRAQGEDYVKQLLQFYLDNKEKFRDPRIKNKHVWRMFGPKVGLSSEECDRKFRNLKQTYIRLVERKNCGKISKWPYYNYFEKIFNEPTVLPHDHSSVQDDVVIMTMSNARRAMQQHRKGYDKFETLVRTLEESNNIQRERNRILQALLDKN